MQHQLTAFQARTDDAWVSEWEFEQRKIHPVVRGTVLFCIYRIQSPAL